MSEPESLSLWDRLFNRTRKVVRDTGEQYWYHTYGGVKIESSRFVRRWVEYTVIDRVTGSETIEREYLT